MPARHIDRSIKFTHVEFSKPCIRYKIDLPLTKSDITVLDHLPVANMSHTVAQEDTFLVLCGEGACERYKDNKEYFHAEMNC